MTVRLLDLWPDGQQRNTRLLEELTFSAPAVHEVTSEEPAPDGYFVQSIDPWMDDCLDRRYHNRMVSERGDGSPYFLDVLPENATRDMRRRAAMLFVDGSIEGGGVWPVASVRALYDEVAAMGLPKSSVGLATANHFMHGAAYRAALAEVEPEASLFLHNCYLSKAARVFAERHGPEFELLRELALARTDHVGGKTRDYLSLNYFPRAHRIAMVAKLIVDGAFDNGFISFSDLNNLLGHKRTDTSEHSVERQLKELFDADSEMLEGARQLRAKGRLVLDEDLVESRLLDFKIPRDAALNSWFSIVSETGMSQESSIYITEKILKPIPYFHPFIVFGSPHSLAYLRSIGFKTFSPFFDESYDQVLDPKARFYACYAEVRRLIALSPAEKRTLIRHLWPVLEHNARHLLFTVCATIGKTWSGPILATMRTAHSQ